MPTYQGFNFSSTLDWISNLSTSSYQAYSGAFNLINNQGGVGTINNADLSDFTFDGLWAKGASLSGSILHGTIKGFNNGTEVWSINTSLLPGGGAYEFISGQAQPIDELHLGLGNYFLVDNLSLTPSAVPVPGAIWLFSSTMIGLIGMKRRKSVV
ncbi:MAG: hypothetical protein ABL903_02715 [Methylococcales bacterium]